MIKPYPHNKSSKGAVNTVRAEQCNADDLDICGNAVTVKSTRTPSEIQGLCDAIDKQITLMCERMDCLKSRLHPVLKAVDKDEDVDVDLIADWGAINKTVQIDDSSTPIGQQLEAHCARLAAVVTSVNVLIDRLGV